MVKSESVMDDLKREAGHRFFLKPEFQQYLNWKWAKEREELEAKLAHDFSLPNAGKFSQFLIDEYGTRITRDSGTFLANKNGWYCHVLLDGERIGKYSKFIKMDSANNIVSLKKNYVGDIPGHHEKIALLWELGEERRDSLLHIPFP